MGAASCHGCKLAGTYSRAVLNRLLTDLSWASGYMEANTYSRLDTLHVIEEAAATQGKGRVETRMILNHKVALSCWWTVLAAWTGGSWSRYLLMSVHAALEN